MGFAMELILTPLILDLVTQSRRACQLLALVSSACEAWALGASFSCTVFSYVIMLGINSSYRDLFGSGCLIEFVLLDFIGNHCKSLFQHCFPNVR